MAKKRVNKPRSNGPLENPPTLNKKIKKSLAKKKKQVKTIDEASTVDIVPSTSTPSTTLIASNNTTPNESNKGETHIASANVATPTDINKEEKKEEKGNDGRVFGFIFMCNGRTKPQCYQYRVFGLPKGRMEEVEKIKAGSKLFLFDFDLKLLYGIYEASSKGQMNVEQDAFNGRFPAQVRFKIFKDCLPLPEAAFKNAIRDNYEGSKFRPELTKKQVKALISLFRPITVPLPTAVAPLASNVVPLHSFPGPLVVEQLPPPSRLPPRQDPYLTVQHTHAPLVFHPHSAQVGSSSRYDHYEAGSSVARVQPLIEEPHVVRQTTLSRVDDPYYPYRRYANAPEMAARDRPHGGYGTLPPRANESLPPIEALVDYYSQFPPRAAAEPLRRPLPGRPGLPEPGAPVSSLYSFAGPAPTFR